jgi:hypothetical protein
MARQRLIESPSGGKSEVLETLHYEGAIRSGVQVLRLSIMVSRRYGGDEATSTGDPQFLTDTKTVLKELSEAGYVEGFDPVGNAAVNLTAEQPDTADVILTDSGRAQARHPRPKPRRLRG